MERKLCLEFLSIALPEVDFSAFPLIKRIEMVASSHSVRETIVYKAFRRSSSNASIVHDQELSKEQGHDGGEEDKNAQARLHSCTVIHALCLQYFRLVWDKIKYQLLLVDETPSRVPAERLGRLGKR